MDYKCVQCGAILIIPQTGEGDLACPDCGFVYTYSKNYLKYDFEKLLFKQFKKKYLLNKVLNNNGFLGYHFLCEGSLSLSGRKEVSDFKKYILFHVPQGKVLDVGCGILDMPGYLAFENQDRFEFYGIDPIDDRSFKGVRITGCAELMPFQDNFFDALIFATSLDHVCSAERAIFEAYRVLSHKGKIIIWMADQSMTLTESLRTKVISLRNRMRKPPSPWVDVFNIAPSTFVRVNHFAIYPNLTVLYIPKGAVDPFHASYESPRRIIKFMAKAKFVLLGKQYHHKNEVFLCFKKT
jgi:ubiquinone/menaquinone biosynthesis C-methylase UbiE